MGLKAKNKTRMKLRIREVDEGDDIGKEEELATDEHGKTRNQKRS
jgi:hypothetical protein